jgi:hypothetical protein
MTNYNEEFRRNVLQQAAALEIKMENMLGSIRALMALVANPEPEDKLAGINPKDPQNKLSDKKLSDRGAEVCYRLFDAGKSRYAVGALMGISFSAASYRYDMWQQAGGLKRTPQPLD